MENHKIVDEFVQRSALITTKKEIETLAKNGFKTIISLESIKPHLQRFAKERGIKVYNIPIDEYEAPTLLETLRMIVAVEKTKASGAKTLIHCLEGKHRSGVMATLYLAAKGMHPLQAYHAQGYHISDRQKEFLLKKGESLAQMVKRRNSKIKCK